MHKNNQTLHFLGCNLFKITDENQEFHYSFSLKKFIDLFTPLLDKYIFIMFSTYKSHKFLFYIHKGRNKDESKKYFKILLLNLIL